MQAAAESAVADIFLGWLNQRLRSAFAFDQSESPRIAVDGDRRLAIFIYPLFEAGTETSWSRRSSAVADQLRQRSGPPLTLWVPPSTDFPAGDRTEFLRRIAEAGSTLQPGQRGQVEFPVTLSLKKQSDDASYVHVVGGLAPYWARFTGRAYGQYVLDTTALHRLPEPEQRITDLVEWIALVANGLKAGASSEIKAEDAWTVSRPVLGEAVSVIGAGVDDDPTDGTSVRKALRAALKDASGITTEGGVARALVLTGVFRRLDDENATIALRGCDPALYSGFDLIALVADGLCKPLLGPAPNSVLMARGA